MFYINEDNSIYATRGDIVFFAVTAEDEGKPYKFQAGDVLRIKVYGKKAAENVVLEKDFIVAEVAEKVEIFLSEEDTKIGEVISKPVDYWYEVELNPDENPQTIIGYDDDGAKVFKLFPEGADIDSYEPDPDDFPVVDEELDMTSPRPLANRVIAKAFASLLDGYERVYDSVASLYVTPAMFGAIGDGEADDTEAIQAAIDAAKRVTGATVVIPAGIYKITAPLNVYSHTRLIGYGKRGRSNEGYSGTHIQYTGNPTLNIIQTEDTDEIKYGIEMKDIRVSGDAVHGVSMAKTSECCLEHICVNGGCEVGVYLEGTIAHLDNLYVCANEIGVHLHNAHATCVSHLNAWQNSQCGILVSGSAATISIRDSWVENSPVGVEFSGSRADKSVLIDTVVFDAFAYTASSEYPDARMIKMVAGDETGYRVQQIAVNNCTAKINKTDYAIEVYTPDYNTEMIVTNSRFICNNGFVSAIYNRGSKYNRFIQIGNTCSNYGSGKYPIVSGSCNMFGLQAGGSYMDIQSGYPLRLEPIRETIQTYTEGQFYYKNGRLMLTDGTKSNKIPIQGETIYGVSVNEVTLPELAQKVNDLLTILRESNAIT